MNGKEYKLTITVYNQSDELVTSDAIIFQTSSRPTVTINTIPIINSNNYNFTAVYNQLESVPIRSWIVYLYDNNQNLISDSGIQVSSKLEYLFSNITSNTSYFIEWQVTSGKNLVGTSGKIRFTVQYDQPQLNTVITAENYNNASIKLSWHVVRILGATEGATSFIDSEKIDVTNGKVKFQDGVKISNNFTLKLWIENPEIITDSNTDEEKYLILLKGDNGIIFLQYRNDNRFHLFKKINNGYSHYVSNQVTGTKFFVCFKQIDKELDIYSIAYV